MLWVILYVISGDDVMSSSPYVLDLVGSMSSGGVKWPLRAIGV